MTLFSQTEAAITIDGPAGAIQAKAVGGSPDGALAGRNCVVVVCHPHPQHGGTMDNKVVTTLVRTYRALGVSVVRFNFRGVGQSEGEFDQGAGEVEDLLAVLQWLKVQSPGAKLLLAGFSFGSAVAAAAVYRTDWRVQHLTLIAPPVERYPYDKGGRFPCPVCVVQGEKDDVVESEGVLRWCGQQLKSPCQLLRYPKAGHFFHGGLTDLKRDLMATIPSQLSREQV